MSGGAPLCLGLHITKCAGTSLMTTLRRVLTEEEHYFFSSYYESWLASRAGFADIVDRDRLRIVFGHYCHETLLSVFAHRPIFLFTGLREPVACAVSGYRQVNAVLAQAGQPAMPAGAYLASHANPICTEVLRCFPSLDAGGRAAVAGAPWERARAALSLFDFVYDAERFDDHVGAIFAVLDIARVPVASDNLSDGRPLPPGADRLVAAGCAEISARAAAFLADDLRLYSEMRPHIGRTWLRRAAGPRGWAPEPWALDRDAFAAGLPAPEAALAIFGARERDFLAHEFEQLGRIAVLRASLEARIRNAAATLARLGSPPA